jgi:hypothetical protein
MNAEMQFSTFTHGRCRKCGFFAKLDKFEQKKINESKSEGEAGTMEMYQLVLKCPLCGDEFCEALYPNEIN